MSWREDLSATDWDAQLARLGGHPLQSALWGDARARVDGIEDRRIAAFDDDGPIWMGRVEVRPLPGRLGKAAWIPKGPVCPDASLGERLHAEFRERLRNDGFWMAIENRYARTTASNGASAFASPPYRTIWVDLTAGEDALWRGLHKKWRYRVGLADRSGVWIEQTRDPADVQAFFDICRALSQTKGFSLPTTVPLMQTLLDASKGGAAEATLFVARAEGAVAAGAFVLRAGPSIHYLWGGTDRAFSKKYAGEAVQWGVMKWGVQQGYARYDLEGINPQKNPGVYQFKVRMGGEEVELAGQHGYPLNRRGRLALKLKQFADGRSK